MAVRRVSAEDCVEVEALTRRIWTGRVSPESTVFRETPASGAQLAIRTDQPRLIVFYEGLDYRPADDVELTTLNPLSPPPFGMRKIFRT